MKYLCWDIDGTLLLTNNAGRDALLEAIYERYHKTYRFRHSLAGRTDSSIVKEIITDLTGRCTSAAAASLLVTYHKLLQHSLPTHKGRIMPNVKSTLSYLKENRPDWQNCLLTGNTYDAAASKIKYYGLSSYFDFNHSVYGDLSEDRCDLAKILFTRLLADRSITGPQDLLVIGDTIHDAACAQVIKVPCLIVMAGSSAQKADFDRSQPWKIIDRLPEDPFQFGQLLDSLALRPEA